MTPRLPPEEEAFLLLPPPEEPEPELRLPPRDRTAWSEFFSTGPLEDDPDRDFDRAGDEDDDDDFFDGE